MLEQRALFTALSACGITLCCVFVAQTMLGRSLAWERGPPVGRAEAAAPTKKRRKIDKDLIDEQLSRNAAFLTSEGLEKVRSAFVIVVGVGGVGSWVATMLTRSGIGRLRIIDFDQVTLSSLNRHAVAELGDVGISKVQCLKDHLADVAPWVHVEPCSELWQLSEAERLLAGNPSFVVDAIDNLQNKVDLLHYCHTHHIPVVASMGAGCKADPTRTHIADISATAEDPLSRTTRRLLRLKGVTSGIPTVFSSEKPDPRKAKLLPLPEEEFAKGGVGELSVLPDFRARILPVLGTMPGIFGLTLATHILTTIAGYPTEPVLQKNRSSLYSRIAMDLNQQNLDLFGVSGASLDANDVAYLMEEVFRGKSAVSGIYSRVTLTRWKRSGPLSSQNVVCMNREEAKHHLDHVLRPDRDPHEVYPREVIEAINRRFEQDRYYSHFRA